MRAQQLTDPTAGEIPTYRDHYYVIDQYGQTIRLSDQRVLERQGNYPEQWGEPLRKTWESIRVQQTIERWVDRFCRRHDLLQVGDVWLKVARWEGDPSQHMYLGWKIMAVARDRRVDTAYPVGTKAPVPPAGYKLLRVLARD